ncbi:MAG: DUF1152 domain-containing protein [Thermoleophilaceae bacterium]|nr:DUF1152 domain-containing protein [Thermoleophilaceae bacterium]
MDAERLLSDARRPLCIGIGGGGDVVGALATGEACRIYSGARPVVGGVTWERRPIDPLPGPRRASEIAGAEPLAPGVMLARAETCVEASGVRFAEARMAEFLGDPTVLVDVNEGPATLAGGLAAAAAALDCDLLVLVDVGGDALAHGDEPGLASPLCDALMLAAGARLAGSGDIPVLAGVFGVGCDGELRPAEVLGRLAEVGRAGGLAGWRGLTEPVVERLDAAVEAVPTEASAQALRCFRGELGEATIRGGRRTVELSPVGAGTVYVDPAAAVASAARLAAAVLDCADIDAGEAVLRGLGVRTELAYEREAAHTT